MTEREIFNILGIELTKDEAVIRNAYREKLKVTNPEDHPEEFKRLRQAYEEACAYARKSEEPTPERDETPSGVWAEKAASLYRSLSLRCSEDAWKALFNEDAFLSLDGNEECRKKLLIFMMNHYHFPFEIWKLLDKNLNITKDSDHLKESFPADYVRFLVRRCREEDGVDYSLFEDPDEGDYDRFLAYYQDAWRALDEGNAEETEQAMQNALSLGITHPYMELIRARICSMRGQMAETEEILGKLTEECPKDIWLLYQTAEYYWGKDAWEQAATYFKRIKELDGEHYMANVRLAHYYEKQQDYPAVEECIRLLSHAWQDPNMKELLERMNARKIPILEKKWKEEQDTDAALELALCLYDEKRNYASMCVLEQIKGKVPEDKKNRYYQILSGAYMGLAEFDKALDTVGHCEEEGHYLAKCRITTYHNMGRGFKKSLERAVEEYERIAAEVSSEIGLQIEMAQLYEEKEEYEKSLEIGRRLWEDYQISYAWVLMLKAYAGMYDANGVIYCARQCIQTFPDYVYPYEELARVYYQTDHKEELKVLLSEAKGKEPPETWEQITAESESRNWERPLWSSGFIRMAVSMQGALKYIVFICMPCSGIWQKSTPRCIRRK